MKQLPINAQYNVAKADSLPVRIAARARARMFARYCERFPPDPLQSVMDVGVTSDRSYSASNYFEAWYPYKDRITAVGIDDASFLESEYPGLKFVHANALALPFEDGSFDVVHSSAVIEHVGGAANQLRYVAELCRVARKGVFFTTPNRWFPVEFHTVLPLVHWLPKPVFRAVVSRIRGDFFALEDNLNLLTPAEVRELCARIPGFDSDVGALRLGGWPSNILVTMSRQ